MATAMALTEGRNAGRYDVTVYQLGWRLGGKGASGRNAAACSRIEEHGLHIWFGFYYNALPLMQRCYEELTGDHDAWRTAFRPHHYVVLEEHIDGEWKHLHMPFPPRHGRLLTPREYLEEILRWMHDALGLTDVPRRPPRPRAGSSAPSIGCTRRSRWASTRCRAASCVRRSPRPRRSTPI
jgi:uncharacterized protein with NAD-binding domain and iron-sulfur cluster